VLQLLFVTEGEQLAALVGAEPKLCHTVSHCVTLSFCVTLRCRSVRVPSLPWVQ
jgi:hypothetical protein